MLAVRLVAVTTTSSSCCACAPVAASAPLVTAVMTARASVRSGVAGLVRIGVECCMLFSIAADFPL